MSSHEPKNNGCAFLMIITALVVIVIQEFVNRINGN
jgi:hypothetical protein